MGCVSSKNNKVKIKIVDIIDKMKSLTIFHQKAIFLKMDSIYNVSKIDVLFDNRYTNSIRLWSKTEEARKHFLRIERTLINSTPNSSGSENNNISLDTVH